MLTKQITNNALIRADYFAAAAISVSPLPNQMFNQKFNLLLLPLLRVRAH